MSFLGIVSLEELLLVNGRGIQDYATSFVHKSLQPARTVMSDPSLKLVDKWAKTYLSYTPHQKKIHLHCHYLPAQQGPQLPACDR